MISRDTIDKINQLSITDVVNAFYKGQLKKNGTTTLKGSSPWTDEKTPSFYVVPHKNIFKDFSSGKGGGSIHFVMEHENLSYPEAIRAICKACSVPLEEEQNGHDPKETEFTEELYKINRATARRYAEMLWEMTGMHSAFDVLVNELFDKRQFTDETISQWQIGYAPDTWNSLSKLLTEKGFYKHGVELGLIKTKAERSYDAFRHRVIFPVHDERGHVVAFGGRYLPGSTLVKEDENDKPVKYINSPESRIFIKSKILYGLYFAIAGIRKKGYAQLVEGYTDVISMHQAGFTNTVGSMGTSLTEDQVLLLKRYTNKVILFFDPDPAGTKAAMRSIDMFLAQGFQVDICPLPEGKDPDDFVRMF